MSSEARRKVREWHRAVDGTGVVKLQEAVDLTVNPSVVRATFPGLTPFRRLSTRDILTELVQLPSISTTSHVSFLFGALWTLTQLSRRTSGMTAKSISFLRLFLGVVLMVVYSWFLKSRQPVVASVSKLMNVSSSPKGPCRVMNNILSISNSHAGTHADTPQHFCYEAHTESFDNDHYTGDVVIVDISDLLEAETVSVDNNQPRPITRRIMETISTSLTELNSPVWRLLLVTRRLSSNGDGVWEPGFAYLERETVQYISETYPLLLLIGTDAPSVDHPNAAPIYEAAHGALYEKGIAILENLQFVELYDDLKNSRVLRGSTLTVFNETESFSDSRGCHVSFFPAFERGTVNNEH
ncbi:Kynurenine formamidase/cyclase-like [Trypanosoma melophagium]|uniref:Kynurenine formamidase/cyclase-like n=1 Tax=Trypanosoma melophagium TaxID=715481 RepID=UPI003519D867|nr:Kynurenine formamidase/cyclase-like [Trypanosoma melophagium]